MPTPERRCLPGGGSAAGPGRPLLTVGHGTLGADRLAALLRGAGVDLLVDVRRFPGSRAHPHLAREALVDWLPAAGVGYRWEERLGGRRRLDRGVVSPDTWWTVEAFRAYAAHTRSAGFGAALDELLVDLDRRAVAVMCSESVWWRCHRRLVADVAVVARGRQVRHLMPDGRQAPHRPSPGARLRGDGLLVWDGPASEPGSTGIEQPVDELPGPVALLPRGGEHGAGAARSSTRGCQGAAAWVTGWPGPTRPAPPTAGR